MILEVAEIYIKEGSGAGFEAGMKQSLKQCVGATEGFISAELQRGIENPSRYILLIKWESVEAHDVNFREGDDFKKHRALIAPYFTKPPFAEHFELAD